jgi:5-oxoprolinase (ATP-hydrolysing)
VVARRPDGKIETRRLLSENPERYADAAVEAIRQCLELRAGEPISPGSVAAVKMGTTVATNALLERAGERVLLLITAGFRDLLRIGTQARPDLFALNIRRAACRRGGRDHAPARGDARAALRARMVVGCGRWR